MQAHINDEEGYIPEKQEFRLIHVIAPKVFGPKRKG